MKKALILLSGGVDSAVVLWWAKNQGWNLATLSFFFPGRRKKEIWSARKLREMAGSKKNYEVNLPFVDSPNSKNACYIPKRNLMFYGIGASLAEKIKTDFVLGGHYRQDGKVFSDARKSYFRQIERLIQTDKGSHQNIQLLFPFIDSDKKEIVKTGSSLRVPFQYTWSCSCDGKEHCWKCNSCRERRVGFSNAQVKDPLDKKYTKR